MKNLFTNSHAKGESRKSSHLPTRASHARITAFAFLTLCMFVTALVYVVPVPAQHGRDWREAQARKEREFQTCMRPAGVAFQKAISEAAHNLKEAEREAQQAYSAAMHKAKSDAARSAAKKAKQEALRNAKEEARQAHRAAQEAKRSAEQSCRNPKQPETTNNNSNNTTPKKPAESSARSCGGNNATEGTLGHGPRPRNPSVRMDLSVVDETGRPVRGVKTKLWSERQSNGLSCETVHLTDACGNVLMDPIHITKTLQLKLEAKGFEPQMIQVEPSQLDRPYRAVMQAKRQ